MNKEETESQNNAVSSGKYRKLSANVYIPVLFVCWYSAYVAMGIDSVLSIEIITSISFYVPAIIINVLSMIRTVPTDFAVIGTLSSLIYFSLFLQFDLPGSLIVFIPSILIIFWIVRMYFISVSDIFSVKGGEEW